MLTINAVEPSEKARDTWTVGDLLTWTQSRFSEVGIEQGRVDAEHLLAHALGCRRIDLYIQHDRPLGARERQEFREFVRRRLRREPVAYIEGRRGFHALDLDLEVDGRVLIPRPETEHLVDWALELLREVPEARVLDVGTGSGAIALALKHARSDFVVTAVDVDEGALAVAQANARRLELDVSFGRSDLLEGVTLPVGGFELIAANLPYIPSRDVEELSPEVRQYEPRLALDGGDDGLDLVRRLMEQCGGRGPVLGSGGWLLLEIGIGQAEPTQELLRAAGWEAVDVRRDLAGIGRVVAARWPGPR